MRLTQHSACNADCQRKGKGKERERKGKGREQDRKADLELVRPLNESCQSHGFKDNATPIGQELQELCMSK